MLNRGLVVVCDRAWSRDDVSIRSDDLEFTSQVYFNALQGALHRISDRVAVYESPYRQYSEPQERRCLHGYLVGKTV